MMMSVRRNLLILLHAFVCVHSTLFNGRYPGENDTFISTLVEDYRRLCPYSDTCNFVANASLAFYNTDIPCCEDCLCIDSCGNVCCPDRFNARLSEDELARMKYERCVYPQFRPFERKSSNAKKSYLVISQCPPEYQDVNGTRMKCERDYHDFDFNESFEMMLPRSSLNSTILPSSTLNYKNGHCVVCHRAAEAFVLWRPMVACLYSFPDFVFKTPRDISRFVESKPDCNVFFEFPKDYNLDPASCEVMIDKCNMTGNWREYDSYVEEACLSYKSLYKQRFYKNIYKNVHCFMCNGYDEADIDDTCFYTTSIVPSSPVPYTALLNFMSNEETNSDYSETLSQGETNSDISETPSVGDARCSSSSIYDNFMNMCRQLSCAKGFVLSETDFSRCVIEDTNWEYIHKLNLQLQIVPTKTMRLAPNVISFGAEWVHPILIDTQEVVLEHKIGLCGSRSFIKLKKPVMPSVGDILRDGTFNENIEAFLLDIYFFVENVQNVTELIQNFVFKNQLIGHYKMEFISFDPAWFTLNINKDLSTSTIMEINDRLQSLILKEAFEYSLNDPSSGNAILPVYPTYYTHYCSSTISITPSPFCSRITITPDDVSEHKPVSGETLRTYTKVSIGKSVVTFDSYIRMLNGNISVCWEDYQEKVSKYFTKVLSNPSKTSTLFGYISLICLSISIASLIATLIVYMILPKLRTLPGLNIMSLSTWLLLSSSLLFANNFVIVDIEWLCKTLGLLLHFTLLSGFCWMFIGTFHMMRTLTSLTSYNKNAQSSFKTYFKYVAVTEISAIALTAAHVLVSMLTNNTLGYGGHPCYITNPRMNLFFVAIPVSVMMVANLVMYISVIVKILRLPEMGDSKSHDRNNLKIFIKLSTITGLTWIFGIVYELTDVEMFGFLFIIFNASQGVLIMFSFVINKRVASLLFKKTYSASGISSTHMKACSTKEITEASQHVK